MPEFLKKILGSKRQVAYTGNKYLEYNGLAHLVEKISRHGVRIDEYVTTHIPRINETPVISYHGGSEVAIVEVYLNGMRLNPLKDYDLYETSVRFKYPMSTDNNEIMIISHSFNVKHN